MTKKKVKEEIVKTIEKIIEKIIESIKPFEESKEEARHCILCYKTLSMYNRELLCFSCQEIKSGRAHYDSIIEGSLGGSVPNGIKIVNTDYHGGADY